MFLLYFKVLISFKKEFKSYEPKLLKGSLSLEEEKNVCTFVQVISAAKSLHEQRPFYAGLISSSFVGLFSNLFE